ncbi:hypothetical protein OSTOST_23560, partial [Ostertagia ostertagi]
TTPWPKKALNAPHLVVPGGKLKFYKFSVATITETALNFGYSSCCKADRCAPDRYSHGVHRCNFKSLFGLSSGADDKESRSHLRDRTLVRVAVDPEDLDGE